MNVVLILAGLALMALGAAEILRWVSVWLFGKAKACAGQSVLLVLPKGPEDCESLIRAAGERLRWGGDWRVLCVVKDGESREIAKRLGERYKGLEICGPKELERLLDGEAGR